MSIIVCCLGTFALHAAIKVGKVDTSSVHGDAPLGGDLAAVGEELHGTSASDIKGAVLAGSAVHATKREGLTVYTHVCVVGETGGKNNNNNDNNNAQSLAVFAYRGTGTPMLTPIMPARKRLVNHSAWAPTVV